MGEDGRVLRGIDSETYGLKDLHAKQRANPRVRRAVKYLGYDNVVYLETAPEYGARERRAVGAARS